ncbi:MAG: hypothetical protein KY476_07725 [Planctomycetes bacterium]|nr:hypothetical protein [Planctomycetota bacterium]
MRIALFEDGAAGSFGPLVLLRPVFELVCGRFSLRERLFRRLRPTAWGAFVRPDLAEVCRQAHPEAPVNNVDWLVDEPVLLINGRWLPSAGPLGPFAADEIGIVDEGIAWLTLDPLEASLVEPGDVEDGLNRLARTRRPVRAGGRLVARPWEIVEANGPQLAEDFRESPPQANASGRVARELRSEPRPQVEILGPPANVWLDPTADIEPYVVLDAREGPVSIGPRARVQSFTRIEGPCHIDRESQLFRANIRSGTTIGPVCRVGGEVEASILHGWVNKYHDGFLGHAYVCPWTNLGALTTNSDLKSDYSPVRVPLFGEPIDTGLTKVGCYIGDHTKTALGSLFNTGSSIGVMCLVLPGGELLPRHIPSFSCIWHGELSDHWPLERSLETARAAMSRRGCELSSAEERLLRRVYEATRRERDHALRRRSTGEPSQAAPGVARA